MFVSVIRYEVTTVECRQITDLMIGVGPSTSWTGGIVPIATFTVFPFAPRSFQWMPSRSYDGTVSGALLDGRSNWSSGEAQSLLLTSFGKRNSERAHPLQPEVPKRVCVSRSYRLV